jgi:hypothetical protein
MTLRIPTGRESGFKRGHDRSSIGYAGKEYKEFKEFKEFKEDLGQWKGRICPMKLVDPLGSRAVVSISDHHSRTPELLELLELLLLSARPGNQTQFMILDQVRMRRDYAQIEPIAAAIGSRYITGEAEPTRGLFLLKSW